MAEDRNRGSEPQDHYSSKYQLLNLVRQKKEITK